MKETELKNTSETSEMEVQNLSGQDKARKHRKTAKAVPSSHTDNRWLFSRTA